MDFLRCVVLLTVAAVLLSPFPATATDTFQWSGFLVARGSTAAAGPFLGKEIAGQLHLGLDWAPTPAIRGHVHLLGRTDDLGAKDGLWGVTEAFIEAGGRAGQGRFRTRLGLQFLPTSFENIDALWENAYTISSSALNSWFGEEFRPIGFDGAYFRKGLMIGGTIFRGNDTFGALPPERGWAIHDHWIVLGERIPADDDDFTALDETDGHLGWSARAGWRGDRLAVQYTYIDNRSDGLRYGDLFNWRTKFHLIGVEFQSGPWMVIGENGWGPTTYYPGGHEVIKDIRAGYLLVSRRLKRGRCSVRVDSYDDGDVADEALNVAGFLPLNRYLTLGVEVGTTGEHDRAMVQLRYGFSGR